MKKTFKALKFYTFILLILASFNACDKDFSVIESDVLGKENANFLIDSLTLPISAYNKKLDSVQVNNLPSNLLGVFYDPDYGKTTASIVTQLIPSSFTEDFGTNPVIDSVVINIPYFNSAIDVDNDGNITYQLDSVYGNLNAKYKLTIYQNNYFLRDFDPFGETITSQNYFSKTEDLLDPTHNYALNGTQEIDFDNHLGEVIIDTTFAPTAKAIVLKTGEGDDIVETRSTPAFRVSFNDLTNDADEIAFWNQTIVEKNGDAVLSNANNFKDYFRGLYFKAEADGTDGNMHLLNLSSSDANITIYYTKGETGLRLQDSYVLNFTGNRLNTFINEFTVDIEDGDEDNGDEILYLKGLEGSMAVVDLFPSDEALEDFKDQFLDSEGNQIKLINEAHFEIHDNVSDDDSHIYDRIYAYDINNSSTTIDYQIDPTESTVVINSKIVSLGQRDDTGKFKIRITEYLNNIIQNDSTNYKIGLVLSNNVNLTGNSEILNSPDGDVMAVPSASIISPRGTILHGSNESVNESNRLKLKVFFTEPKDN